VAGSSIRIMRRTRLLGASFIGPGRGGVIAFVHRPVRGVRPGYDLSDVPHGASGQPDDRWGEASRTSPQPHIHSVSIHSQNDPNLLRACQESGVVHVPTIVGFIEACRFRRAANTPRRRSLTLMTMFPGQEK
jgi:hypothetical protein